MLLTETLMKTRLVGNPVVPVHTCSILLFMAYQARMPWIKLTLLACLLFTLHPVLTISGLVLLHTLITWTRPIKRRSATTRPYDASEVDVLIYGGGLRGLYSGALLARAGRRVAVLVPQPTSDAAAIATPEGAPCDFVLERCEFGQVSHYAALLAPCIHPSRSVDFEPIGTAKTGWVSGIMVASDLSQPFPLRIGTQAWIDDLSQESGVDRCILAIAIRQARNVARDLYCFVTGKLPEDSGLIARLTRNEARCTMNSFEAAAKMTVTEAIAHVMPNSHSTRSFSRSSVANAFLCDKEVSFAAWSASIIHGINGYHVPKGGAPCVCASLQATIQACGGRVITNMTVDDVKLTEDRRNRVVVVATPSGGCGRAKTFTAEKVILAVDIPESCNLVHRARLSTMSPSTLNEHATFPKHVHEVTRTLIAFQGTCEDLDAPHAVPIWWRDYKHIGGVDFMDWKTFTFRDAPNGIVACVIEGPAAALRTKTSQGKDQYQNEVLKTLTLLCPKTEGKVIYTASLEKPIYKLAHTPSRYAGSSLLSGLDRVYVALDEFPLSDGAGAIVAGYLAAHAVLEYTQNNLRWPQSDLVSMLKKTKWPLT